MFGLIFGTNPFRVEFGLIFAHIKVHLQEMHDYAQQDNEAARSILRRKIHIEVLLDPFYDILLVKVSTASTKLRLVTTVRYKLVLFVYIVSTAYMIRISCLCKRL